MMSPSRCPPWQPERPGPTRREPRRAQRSYTTPRDTIQDGAPTSLAYACGPASGRVPGRGVGVVGASGTRREPRRAQRSYTTPRDTISSVTARSAKSFANAVDSGVSLSHSSRAWRYSSQASRLFVSRRLIRSDAPASSSAPMLETNIQRDLVLERRKDHSRRGS